MKKKPASIFWGHDPIFMLVAPIIWGHDPNFSQVVWTDGGVQKKRLNALFTVSNPVRCSNK